ncbi:4'-phosphopantetheinyl transferase family protein [Flavobacterium agrisoli]|uniref:4'-phosphopantetheinyl transferase superfamily protein n=1 Tax=Flavobacterium agrisoli TaxID=2793066 RepID=A0A934PQ33_9FLAO|nr:4'-phosphopantetheinyl transferase superfamily protein [Flavobacterium agrisoli]MBK0371018.1 4'-phosphopantetheinyl transferase superfamily protein [Flavobacterium agrisoli]
MPLYQTIQCNDHTQLLIWKITESLTDLESQVEMKPKTQLRFDNMKSELHKRAFLSVRMLLKEINLTDFDLHYDSSGKPYLDGDKHISITHSHQFAALIISDDFIGIDIELQRDKIQRIADKFVDKEFAYLIPKKTEEYIKKLTVIWGAKEAIFKIRNEKGISFKDHIEVNSFQLSENVTTAILHFDNFSTPYKVHFSEIENCTLVYAFVL